MAVALRAEAPRAAAEPREQLVGRLPRRARDLHDVVAIEPVVLEPRAARVRSPLQPPFVQHRAAHTCACERAGGERRKPVDAAVEAPAPGATPYDHPVDPLVLATLQAYEHEDATFVEETFMLLLRRPPDDEARERALAKLASGTLSRATFVHELVTSAEAVRVRELDDAVALGLGARSRGEPLTWLQAPAGTDERVIEIPWVLSRLVPSGRVLEIGYAFAEPVYLAGLLRANVELVGVDLAERDVAGMERHLGDVRALPLPDGSIEQALLVSTLEHVGADNSGYGLERETDPGSRVAALAELGRVVGSRGRVLVTVPLGEPGDHGWFRLDDVDGWNRLFAEAGLFVEEQEAYELGAEGWRAAPAFRAIGVGYGDRGPAASAVLCSSLSVGRLRRLLTPEQLRAAVELVELAHHRVVRQGGVVEGADLHGHRG